MVRSLGRFVKPGHLRCLQGREATRESLKALVVMLAARMVHALVLSESLEDFNHDAIRPLHQIKEQIFPIDLQFHRAGGGDGSALLKHPGAIFFKLCTDHGQYAEAWAVEQRPRRRPLGPERTQMVPNGGEK